MQEINKLRQELSDLWALKKQTDNENRRLKIALSFTRPIEEGGINWQAQTVFGMPFEDFFRIKIERDDALSNAQREIKRLESELLSANNELQKLRPVETVKNMCADIADLAKRLPIGPLNLDGLAAKIYYGAAKPVDYSAYHMGIDVGVISTSIHQEYEALRVERDKLKADLGLNVLAADLRITELQNQRVENRAALASANEDIAQLKNRIVYLVGLVEARGN